MATDPFDNLEQKLGEVWNTVRGEVADPRPSDIEIIEEAETLVLTAEMPQVEREDIRVDVSPSKVVIQAVLRGIGELGSFFRRDRPSSFQKAIALPAEVEPEEAEAHFNNGVLEVVLPKRVRGGVGVHRVPTGP